MMYFLKPKQYDAKLIACAEDCSFVAPHDDAPLHAAGAGELTGFGEFGQPRFAPTALFDGARASSRSLVQLAFGRRHALALFDDGAVYGWGENRLGQVVR